MFVGDQAGRAEEAMTLYTSLFTNSGIISIERYGPGVPDAEGTVQHAVFTLGGREYMAMDSAHGHNFTFTPSMSIFVTCETEDEIDQLFEKLSEGGAVLMDLQDHGFSRKFAWVNDRFGVSWQLNLP